MAVLAFACTKLYVRRARSWLFALVTACPAAIPLLGLFTHPQSPPSTYWVSYLPLNGGMLFTQHALMRVSFVRLSHAETMFSNS